MDARDFWETCGLKFAHLETYSDRALEKDSLMLRIFEKEFLERLDWKSSKVVEYGIGGGYLGRVLIEKYGISKYLGLDIAQRSIDTARKNLSVFGESVSLSRVDRLGDSVSTIKEISFDTFISMACIQHFPDSQYLEDFLLSLNSLDFTTIALQIRFSTCTIFNSAYEMDEEVSLACRTNSSDILKRLKRYSLFYSGEIYPSGYQYLLFRKN